jgi:hypothetical protein
MVERLVIKERWLTRVTQRRKEKWNIRNETA